MGLFEDKNIIVARREYHNFLFKIKRNFPNANVKIITRDELIEKISYSFKKDPIPYLLKKGINYSKAKKYLKLFTCSDFEKNEELNNLFKEIKDEYIKEEELGLYQIKNSKLCLFEFLEDLELKALLKRKNIEFDEYSLTKGKALYDESFDLVPEFDWNNFACYKFQNKFDQYFYIFSDIRKKIVNKEVDPNKIKIICEDDHDIYYVSFFAKMFHLDCYMNVGTPLLSLKEVQNTLLEMSNKKSLIIENNESNEAKIIKGLIADYDLLNLDFNFAYNNLVEILDSLKQKDIISNKGILITNRFEIDDYLTYITNFKSGIFYKTFDDKNILSDAELLKISTNPSYFLTNLDKRFKENYIRLTNLALVSRVKEHLSDSIYDSEFINEGIRCEEGKENKKVSNYIAYNDPFNKDGFFTDEGKNIAESVIYDKYLYLEKSENVRNYDYSYKKINNFVYPHNKYYLTNIESYINCPFKYYLDAVVGIKDDDHHARWNGTLIHKVYETINHPDFDFEKAFEEGKKVYIDSVIRDGFEFDKNEESNLEILKMWLRKTVKVQRAPYENDRVEFFRTVNDAEVKVEYELTDDNGNSYPFSGRIDKIYYTKHEGKLFYTIIDFKSGKESFDYHEVFLGKSIQLPLYYYALNSTEAGKKLRNGADFGGFSIQHNFDTSIKNDGFIEAKSKKITDEQVLKLFQMKDLLSADQCYIKSLDSKCVFDDKKIKTVGSILNSKFSIIDFSTNNSSISKSTEKEYTFIEMIEDAKNAAIDVIHHINDGEFPIKPTSINIKKMQMNNLQCKYCGYKDICYVNKYDAAHSYAKDIENKFRKEESVSKKEEVEYEA